MTTSIHPVLDAIMEEKANKFVKQMVAQAADRILSPIIECIRANPQLSVKNILDILEELRDKGSEK